MHTERGESLSVEASASVADIDVQLSANKESKPRQKHTGFGGVKFHPDGIFHFGVLNGYRAEKKVPGHEITTVDQITHHLTSTSPEVKIIAAGIHGADRHTNELTTKLWLHHDIVPIHVSEKDDEKFIDPHVLAEKASKSFGEHAVAKVTIDPITHEVTPRRLVSKEQYKDSDPEAYTMLEHFAEKFKGKQLFHVSSTPQGGGVALMRHAEIDLLNQMGVDAHWGVMKIHDPDVVDITKRSMHNNLQDVPGAKPLTDERKVMFTEWNKKNFEIFKERFKTSDVIVIDDYQPSGMIPYILEVNPDVKILYRSHIQIDTKKTDQEGTMQHDAWRFVWEGGVKHAHAFVSHPMKEFIPANVPMERVVQMGAATDRFDGLNKHLSPEQMDHYLDVVDGFLESYGQTPIDRERPWVTQVARFDPSKNIEGVIEEYKLTRDRMEREGRTDLPQLVIAGHGAVDDPDGAPLLEKTMRLLQGNEYRHLASDVKVLRLPHIDQPLNALLQGAKVVMQRSIKEGFEVKVTEALMKGKPVIVSDRGGIPVQVVDGKGAFVVDPNDHEKAAGHLYNLLTDDALHARMSQEAKASANPDYTTVQNTLNWLYLATEVLEKGKIHDGHFSSVVKRTRENFAKENNMLQEIVIVDFEQRDAFVS